MSASHPRSSKSDLSHVSQTFEPPLEYLAQLEILTETCQGEENFVVQLRTGTGSSDFGSATCLDCQQDIALPRSAAVADGGHVRGFGTLAALSVCGRREQRDRERASLTPLILSETSHERGPQRDET